MEQLSRKKNICFEREVTESLHSHSAALPSWVSCTIVEKGVRNFNHAEQNRVRSEKLRVIGLIMP